jgi:hypothetical protein
MIKTKYSALILAVLLISALFAIASVLAQDLPIEEFPDEQYPFYYGVPNPSTLPPPPETEETAIVVLVASVGGTTDPEPGVYEYAYAATIRLEATPETGYRFLYWSISGSYTPGHNQPPINYPVNAEEDPDWTPDFPDPAEVAEDSLTLSQNPLQIICGYGYSFAYQPVFVPVAGTEPEGNVAVVNIVDSVGGSTDPGPGTYTYMEDSVIRVEATPDAGYEFKHWVAVDEMGHPYYLLDNPTAVTCGYGYTYSYQPVFDLADAEEAVGGIAVEVFYATVAVLVIVVVILLALVVMYRGKSR